MLCVPPTKAVKPVKLADLGVGAEEGQCIECVECTKGMFMRVQLVEPALGVDRKLLFVREEGVRLWGFLGEKRTLPVVGVMGVPGTGKSTMVCSFVCHSVCVREVCVSV